MILVDSADFGVERKRIEEGQHEVAHQFPPRSKRQFPQDVKVGKKVVVILDWEVILNLFANVIGFPIVHWSTFVSWFDV